MKSLLVSPHFSNIIGTYPINAVPFGEYIYFVVGSLWFLILWWNTPIGWGKVYVWHYVYFTVLCAFSSLPVFGASLQIIFGWIVIMLIIVIYSICFGWRDKKSTIDFQTQKLQRLAWFHYQTKNKFAKTA